MASAAPADTATVQAIAAQALVTNPSAAKPVSTADLIRRGQLMMDVRDANAAATLQAAAQQSLSALAALAGSNILTAPPERMPTEGAPAEAARQAAVAHYLWGQAEDRLRGERDRAIAALARAVRFAGDNRSGNNRLARDVRFDLNTLVREGGLPLHAADDTLDTIAAVTHFGLWTPRRFRSDFSNIAFAPTGPTRAGAAAQGRTQTHEFLVTSGRLFSSGKKTIADPEGALSRIPPPYRNVPLNALPDVLKLGPLVIGYAKETEGRNRGLWRQVVRVFYASPALTRDNRNDRPRAEALCAQFLKLHALVDAGLGLSNTYTPDSITTLWLSEVSALWPNDEDDPAIVALLGPRMPKPNTPLVPGARPETTPEIEMSPLQQPWRAAGYLESNPGDITFFKMTQPRDESEWLRELAHEYGHVALPALNGFEPPLEPYGNGLMGETLGMLWAAAAPGEFVTPIKTETMSVPATSTVGPTAEFAQDLQAHIVRQAMGSLRFWKAQGPGSALRGDSGSDGLRYLQGLTTYIERVYGAHVLGAALRPLVGRSTRGQIVFPTGLNTDSLLDSLARGLRDPFESGRTNLPLWLPGALEVAATSPSRTASAAAMTPVPINPSVAEFTVRAPSQLRAGQRAACWLFVPLTARTLHVEWKVAALSKQAVPLTVEGGGKTSFQAPLLTGATHAVNIDVGAKTGWQRFAFTAPTEIAWTGAWFVRAPTPPGRMRAATR
ncbi:MAG: hypothetical protein M3347_01735 [Armatimonadota bacterium]|nr:hypothetical protein [Armatimonadota bacterium]